MKGNGREVALNVATALVTAVALVVAGPILWDRLSGNPDDVRVVREWRDYVTEGHRVGDADADVTIVEFVDYQCPYCQQAATDLETLVEHFNGDVALVIWHYPLEFHEHAWAAARAAEGAAVQGRFYEMHRALYDGMDSIGITPYSTFARRAGVTSVDEFDECSVAGSYVESRIHTDTAAALRLGATGTPTFLVNARMIVGYPGRQVMENHVRAELRR